MTTPSLDDSTRTVVIHTSCKQPIGCEAPSASPQRSRHTM